MLTTPPQPRLTGGSERPAPPCADNPLPFDLAIEYQERRGQRFHHVVAECRAICSTCPIWQECLREFRDHDGVIAGLTIYERTKRKSPTKRKGCGKPHGSSAHYRAGEEACRACLDAAAKAKRERCARRAA